MERKELPSMAADSIKLPNKEKARDVLIKKLNDAIKEFEDGTGVKVTSVSGNTEMIMAGADEIYSDISWKLNTKL